MSRAFLDACVLYPPLVRALLIGAAEAELFVPLWSARVLAEWRIAVAAKRGMAAEGEALAAQAAMAARFPEAQVEAGAEVEAAIRLPDPADAHVLAAAAAGGAEALVTFNLRDFPRRVLAGQGIEARHPDGFLWELWSVAPDRMDPVVGAALAAAGIGPERARAALKRAKLPRLGKAVAGGAGDN
ncbi:MAG TPA: PIN domain-containing protein [Paracoccaceae bacterium]|nr:PIN domain-containing protein [Paracoccaceae bacterium]